MVECDRAHRLTNWLSRRYPRDMLTFEHYQMTHEVARTIMRRIAMDYDRLAKLAEEQIADQERGMIDD